MTEAHLVEKDGGLMPEGGGWFVLSAKDSMWLSSPELGRYCGWEGEDEGRFPQLGINLNVMEPGQPMTMYHRENAQEDFLVLEGECLAIVDGEERPLKKWDLFHCPAGVSHAIVGAGTGPSLVLAVGARTGHEDDGLVYPADPTAQKHGAGVPVATRDARVAYESFTIGRGSYEQGWLAE
ncbi:MAG: hypothetical protein QOF43_864 [Gaiellaceae bacterium]|jgi:uncharacterized cupin superfamily protein|nr:hypothetical protein [Gaiellaceae bacterium]